MEYTFTNILGCFVLSYENTKENKNLIIVDQIEFNDVNDYLSNKEKKLSELKDKHSDAKELPKEKLQDALNLFKDQKYFSEFHRRNKTLTIKDIKSSVSMDLLIIQAIANVNELDKVSNILTKRLREWFSLYLPEVDHFIHSHEKFVELVHTKSKEELFEELNINPETSMGADLEDFHVQQMILLAEEVLRAYELRKKHEDYLEKVMKIYCPNILEMCGTTIGAKLIELSRSLKHLAMLPASTVQLLGAEKALFRHIKTGSKCPKYGVIMSHPIIQKTDKKSKGKASRSLADKISLCARLDFFKGEFKAPEYREELEKRLLK